MFGKILFQAPRILPVFLIFFRHFDESRKTPVESRFPPASRNCHISLDRQVLPDQTHGAAFRKSSLRMAEQPFVFRRKVAVFAALMAAFQIQIGPFRQDNRYAEAVIPCIAGRIVEARGKHAHSHSLRNMEGFAGRCVKSEIFRDILLSAQDQIEIRRSDIDLASGMVFQGVQLVIVTVAVADLIGDSPYTTVSSTL